MRNYARARPGPLDEPLPIEDTNSPVHDTWSLEGGIGATRPFVSDFFGGYHASRLLTAEAKTWWNAESVPRISLPPSTVTLASISSASPTFRHFINDDGQKSLNRKLRNRHPILMK